MEKFKAEPREIVIKTEQEEGKKEEAENEDVKPVVKEEKAAEKDGAKDSKEDVKDYFKLYQDQKDCSQQLKDGAMDGAH